MFKFFNKLNKGNLKNQINRYSSISLPSYVLNVPQTKVTTLDNGIRVATEESFGETASVGVWINTGSVYENASNNGVAHFLEHMIFKGTQSRTRQGIELEVENMGAKLNAYTSREQTAFYSNCFKTDVPKVVDILQDIIQNSQIQESDIESEKGVILREMKEVNSQMEEVVFDHLHSIAFQDTPLAYTILGPEENIKNMKRSQLVNWIDTHYTGKRIVVVGAGGVEHDRLVDLVSKKFEKIPKFNKIDLENGPHNNTPFTGSMVNVRNDDEENQHIAIAVRSVGWTHPDFFVFMLLQTMIGNWDKSLGGANNMVSPLAEKLATQKYASSLMTFNTTYKNTGLFGCYAVTHEGDHSTELCRSIIKEWVRLSLKPNENELQRAKNKLKSSLLLQIDGTFSVAEDIGRQMLTIGRRMTPAEMFTRIDSINLAQLQRVANEYLYDVDLAIVGVGSTKDFPDYNEFRGWNYTFFN